MFPIIRDRARVYVEGLGSLLSGPRRPVARVFLNSFGVHGTTDLAVRSSRDIFDIYLAGAREPINSARKLPRAYFDPPDKGA